MRTITLIPAYGIDYTSKAKVLTDWNDNMDFKIADFGFSGYVNNEQIEQLKKDGITHLQFRYSKLTKVFILELV
jgi:hypothetical protein